MQVVPQKNGRSGVCFLDYPVAFSDQIPARGLPENSVKEKTRGEREREESFFFFLVLIIEASYKLTLWSLRTYITYIITNN